MDSNQEDGVDIGNRQRKFGLPGWMVNNIERLNFATDFEQYACSPPETEGYLTDYMENDASPISPDSPVIERKTYIPDEIKNESRLDSQSEELSKFRSNNASRRQPCHSLLESIRHDDLYSSPDSTPCATPEPSPVIRRKLSIPHMEDTIQSNPGRWFYMGKLRKAMPNCLPPHSIRENKVDVLDSGVVKHADSKPNKSAIKLVISNFDLNAVSPNSW